MTAIDFAVFTILSLIIYFWGWASGYRVASKENEQEQEIPPLTNDELRAVLDRLPMKEPNRSDRDAR